MKSSNIERIIELLSSTSLSSKSLDDVCKDIKSLKPEDRLEVLSIERKLESQETNEADTKRVKKEIYLVYLSGLSDFVSKLAYKKPPNVGMTYLSNQLTVYGIMRLIDKYEEFCPVELDSKRLQSIKNSAQKLKDKEVFTRVQLNQKWKNRPYNGKTFYLHGQVNEQEIKFYINQLGCEKSQKGRKADFVIVGRKSRISKKVKNSGKNVLREEEFIAKANDILITYIPTEIIKYTRKKDVNGLPGFILDSAKELVSDLNLNLKMKNYVNKEMKKLVSEVSMQNHEARNKYVNLK